MSRRRLPRVALGAAALLVASFALAACGSDDSDDPAPSPSSGDVNAPAEITFLTFQSPNLTKEFWEARVAEIQKTYPDLKVNIEYTPGLDRQGYAKQLLATGNLPDVIWDVPLQDFVKAKALLPYNADAFSDVNAPIEQGQIDGKNYALNVGQTLIPAIYYNKTEFDKLGLQPPTTWDELLSDAAAVKDAGQTPFVLGGASDTWGSTVLLNGIITADVLGANPNWLTDRAAGDVKFTDDDMKAAVDKWLDLYNDGYFNSDALSLDFSQMTTKFTGGDGVMFPMGSWAGATTADFDLGVFPIPSETGKTVLGINFGQALAVSAKTEYPAQAQAFAVALATGTEAVKAQLQSDGVIPVLKDFQLPDDTAPLIKETISLTQTAGAEIVPPFGWSVGDGALPTGFTAEFDKGAQQLLSGQGSVDDFLSGLDATYDDLSAG